VHTPDLRSGPYIPYAQDDLGIAEWGIRHSYQPITDNRLYAATYRDINAKSYGGWTLAALIMGKKTLWNHNALFDYIDRWKTEIAPTASLEGPFDDVFVTNMWDTYRASYNDTNTDTTPPAAPTGLGVL